MYNFGHSKVRVNGRERRLIIRKIRKYFIILNIEIQKYF
jgi:hypothetical protein